MTEANLTDRLPQRKNRLDDGRSDGLEAFCARSQTVFGHRRAILPTYDALASYEAAGKIHHVLRVMNRARIWPMATPATGRVGVCICTSGPAATNLVTGLATALMDSVPVVAVTGQVPTNLLGTDAFQESDVVGVTQR